MRVSASGRPKMAFAAGPLQADLWSNTAAKRYHGFLSRNRILAPGLSDACDDPAL
jgi:protein-L-isoaspartate(D-aspartate) O-methyltransferase